MSALARFEAVISAAWPTAFAALRPGASDNGIQRLRDAVAPFRLPTQLEALYRWRDGGDDGVFGGWRMRAVDELLEAYEVNVGILEAPRTWLPVFDDQIINVVTLNVPGLAPSDESVWYSHTHDDHLCRMFDSLEAMPDVVCDAADAGALTQDAGRLAITGEDVLNSRDDMRWAGFRLARSPGSYSWPDPVPGTDLSRSPNTDWPGAWRAGISGRADTTAPGG